MRGQRGLSPVPGRGGGCGGAAAAAFVSDPRSGEARRGREGQGYKVSGGEEKVPWPLTAALVSVLPSFSEHEADRNVCCGVVNASQLNVGACRNVLS